MRTRIVIAALGLVLAAQAHAARDLGVIRVVGVDGVCASFTASVDGSNNTVLTCLAGSGGAGAPTGCTGTVNGTTTLTLTSAGGNASLAASCSSPGSGITYSWSRNNAFGASTLASWTDTLPNNNSTTVNNVYNYQVRACVSSDCVTVPVSPLVVTVPATGGNSPGLGWNGTCPGFASTQVLDLNWAVPTRLVTSGFTLSDVLVVRFTTGSNNSSNNLPHITAVEYGGVGPAQRTGVLSATPCDFAHQATPGAIGVGNTITSTFAIGNGSGFGFYPVLQTNTTYYLNIKNNAGGGCGLGAPCDMSIDLIKANL